MTLQSDFEKLSNAWLDLVYAICRTAGVVRLARRLGMTPRAWVTEREKKSEGASL